MKTKQTLRLNGTGTDYVDFSIVNILYTDLGFNFLKFYVHPAFQLFRSAILKLVGRSLYLDQLWNLTPPR